MQTRIETRLPPCITLGALINVGMLGLIDASQKCDPTCASTFRQYARQQRITTPCTTSRCSDAVETITQGRERKTPHAHVGGVHEPYSPMLRASSM